MILPILFFTLLLLFFLFPLPPGANRNQVGLDTTFVHRENSVGKKPLFESQSSKLTLDLKFTTTCCSTEIGWPFNDIEHSMPESSDACNDFCA
jgi:hypothetical protein